MLGRFLRRLGNLVVARRRPDSLVAEGSALLAAGEIARARDLGDRALRSSPQHAGALRFQARVALQSGNAAASLAYAQKAVALAPEDAASQLALGEALIGCGKREAAAAAFVVAIAADPRSFAGQRGLARALEGAVGAGESWALGPPPPPLAGRRAQGKISVVICSIDAAKFSRVTANYRALLAGEPHEIVGIHDARSLCEGYNRGIRRATGEIVVLSHDDIEILTTDFADRLRAHLSRHDVLGVCGTSRLIQPGWMVAGWPYLHGLVAFHDDEAAKYRVLVLDGAVRSTGALVALDGMFIATRREVLARVPFDEATFDGFHLYDLDFSFSCQRAGFDVAVANDLTMIHYTYEDAPGYNEALNRYARKFAAKYAGVLKLEQPGPNEFITASFDTPAQVADFCAALLAARARAANPESGQAAAALGS
jgi:tetratricopeptide (TPR) repeat protein